MSHPLVVHVSEPHDVYVGRPGPWGNPFTVEEHGRGKAIELFKAHCKASPNFRKLIKRDLQGKTLGCWCAPGPCHGDILAAIANDEDIQS